MHAANRQDPQWRSAPTSEEAHDDVQPPWDEMVLVGRIARPHALAGQVVVNPETDFPEERFAPGSRCWLGTAQGAERVQVSTLRLQGGRPIVGFAGIHSVEAAERIVGLELRIPESELRPLADGSYYHHQLVGCTVVTASGDRIGDVGRIEGGAAGSLLVVNGEAGEVLVPLAGGICTEVDIAGRRIVVEPPEGLLDLNVTGRRRRRGRARSLR